MKRLGGVTAAAIVLICAGVIVVLYGLLAILVEFTYPSLPEAKYASVGGDMVTAVNYDDFSAYVDRTLAVLHQNWARALAESGMLNVRGGVAYRVSIMRSGELAAKPVLLESQDNTPQLIKPALAATEKSAPFEALPKAFAGPEVEIRVFFGNEPPEDAAESSVAPKSISKLALVILIAAWGIATGIGILRLRRWAWISMLVIAALLIGIAFTPVPRTMKLIRETTGIPTISAPGFVGMAYAESAIRILTPLALGLWWLLLFPRKSVWAQFSGESATRAGAAAVVPSVLGAQGIQQQDAPEMAPISLAREGITPAHERFSQEWMARSGGVTAAAVVLFFGSGLLILFIGLGSLVLILPRPSNVDQNFPATGLVVGLLSYGLLAAWGIVTAVGILKLRQWARISILVMSGFAAVGILFASLGIFLIAPMMKQTPGMDPSFEKMFLIIWAVMLAIPFGIAIWWFALFMLKGVRLQFAAGGMAASAVLTSPTMSATASAVATVPAGLGAPSQPGAEIAATPHSIPTSIIVIAIFFLAGAPGMVFGFMYGIRLHFPFPFILLGVLITGWKSFAAYASMGIVQLVLGIALLRKKAWSLDPVIAYAVFVTLNSFLFVVSPARDAYFSLIFRNYPVAQSLPPDFMMHMMRVVMPFSMIFGIVLNLVGLYFLWTRRGAYRAACAASGASPVAAR